MAYLVSCPYLRASEELEESPVCLNELSVGPRLQVVRVQLILVLPSKELLVVNELVDSVDFIARVSRAVALLAIVLLPRFIEDVDVLRQPRLP